MSPACLTSRRAVAVIIALAALGLAVAPARAETFALGEADHGRTLALRVGDSVEVLLESNPSTGYVWAFETLGPNVFGSFQQAFEAGVAMPGAGGRHRWVFTVAHAGRTRLDFKYLRPWEGERSLARRLTVDIVVP